MDYNEHKKHFEIAYKTGADFWTRTSVEFEIGKLVEKLPRGARILDLGSGRGFFSRYLSKMGYQVVGLDFESNIVHKSNSEIGDFGLEGKLEFVDANVLKMPFPDSSFDAACDLGLFETLYKEDWRTYISEINRVLKPGGAYLNISLSRKTISFFDYSPLNSEDGEFEKYGIHYHFFEKEEMEAVFKDHFKVEHQTIEFTKKDKKIAFIETLFQKIS